VRVDLGRASLRSFLLLVVLFSLLVAGGVYAAATAPDRATAIVGYCVAGVFALPLLFAALAPQLLRARALDFDRSGIMVSDGATHTRLPWDAVAGVAVTYETPPSLPHLPGSVTDALKDYLVGKIGDAVGIKDFRRLAVEIFPVDPAPYPALRHRLVEAVAPGEPADELPALSWRIVLPPSMAVARQIAAAVIACREDRWRGPVQRPWGTYRRARAQDGRPMRNDGDLPRPARDR
jgi:hypothetical protein